jgi:hypothetical protein
LYLWTRYCNQSDATAAFEDIRKEELEEEEEEERKEVMLRQMVSRPVRLGFGPLLGQTARF